MMKRFCIAIAAIAGALCTSAQGSLVISEVVYNEVGSSFLGEWIEIYNGTASSIDLSNYKIGDEETSGQTANTEALYQFPAGATIAAGEVQIVASGAVRFAEVYGFAPDYEFSFIGDGTTSATDDPAVPNLEVYSAWDSDGNRLNMSNSNDQAVLVDPADAIIDTLSWGNTFAFTPGLVAGVQDGQSYERINASIDTNTADDWQLGSLSSPGTVVVPEPSSMLALALLGAFCRKR
jgi:hypothetical protein